MITILVDEMILVQSLAVYKPVYVQLKMVSDGAGVH